MNISKQNADLNWSTLMNKTGQSIKHLPYMYDDRIMLGIHLITDTMVDLILKSIDIK